MWKNNILIPSIHCLHLIFIMVSGESSSNENSILNTHTPISTPTSPIEIPLIAFNISAQINEKLTSSTFPQWRAQFEALFIGYDLLDYVTGDHPCPQPTTPLHPLFTNLTQSIYFSPCAHSSSRLTSLPVPIAPQSTDNTSHTHFMITRSMNNIYKPKQLHSISKHPITPTIEPICVS